MIVAGIDPGRHTGWSVVDSRCNLVMCGTIETPDRMQAVDSLLDVMRDMRNRYLVQLIAVESTGEKAHGTHHWGDDPDPAVIASKSKHLMHAEHIAGIANGLAAALGFERTLLAAVDWRQAIVGNRFAKDSAIKIAVAMRVRNMPKKANKHENDATGVALYVSGQLRLGQKRVQQAQ